jgi:hypothetical protein
VRLAFANGTGEPRPAGAHLVDYGERPSLYATGRAIGVTHKTVERCLRRARELGAMAALDDSPRPGREPTITSQARTFVVDLACR